MKERIQRVPFRDFANLSAEEREAAEQSKVNGKVVNIFRVMINHPPLARAWGPFGSYILSDRQTLSPRDREFAVLRIAWLNQSPYQFEQHTRISLELGITQAEIDRITEGPKAGWNEHDEADSGSRRFVREIDRLGCDLEDALVELQHPANDGSGVHHR